MKEEVSSGNWSVWSQEGSIGATQINVFDFLNSIGRRADTAKVVEGTDQAGTIYTWVFYKS